MPQITPTAAGFDRLFDSKHPPISAMLARSNHMSALAALEKYALASDPILPKAAMLWRLTRSSG
jgi:hypothetical protein